MSALEKVLSSVRADAAGEAETNLTVFLRRKFALDIPDGALAIRKDSISLNSVNGVFSVATGEKYFFKFHLEESESATVQEYYRAELLARYGYPVEQPLYVSHDVGEQILVYPYVENERLFDVCRRLEQDVAADIAPVVNAQQKLDALCADKCLETLSIASRDDYAAQSVLQLFYWRLVDVMPDGTTVPGGRHHRFYVDQAFRFPGVTLQYDELKDLTWEINGVRYRTSLQQAFDRSREVLAPDAIVEYPACIAHGDAHNGNVWLKEDGSLSWFDPAFAGEKIPVLLAEIKPTFHNIFAHPDWLYDPDCADEVLEASAVVDGGLLRVTHNWALTPLRAAFLESKRDMFWIPVLRHLKVRGCLPANWRQYIRLALFCCPTLVMNLRAGAGAGKNNHTQKTSLTGLSIAIMCASEPENGQDVVSQFLDSLESALEQKEE